MSLPGGTIKTRVLAMYMSHPFPQWDRQERQRRFEVDESARYRYLGLEGHMKGARVLELGVGTGMRSIPAMKHLGVREFVGLDHSSASLAIAKRVAEEEAFAGFTPVEGDLFNVPYEDESFDVVVSWGVLHHTHDPRAGFREMLRLTRPGGFVAIYLYNLYNHWRHNMQKAKVDRLGGADVEKRFAVAHSLYGKKPFEEMSPAEIALFYDQYCHPHKSDHTYGEILRWFDEEGLLPWGTFPPLRMQDFASYVKERRAVRDHPVKTAQNRLVSLIASRLPARVPTAPFRRPSMLHRTFWQGVLMWMGRHGDYSEGSAFSARKPERTRK